MVQNKKYIVFPSNYDIALPGLNQSIQVSQKYDKNVFSKLNEGDEFVFAKSFKPNVYNDFDDVILPAVKNVGVLCKINHIERGEVFTNVEYTGIKIVKLFNFDLDSENAVVVCSTEDKVDDRVYEDVIKYDKLAQFQANYNHIRTKYSQLPALPDFSNVLIDDIPFVIAAFIDCSVDNKVALIEQNNAVDRFRILTNEIGRFAQDSKIDFEIEKKVNAAIEKNQREFILRERAKQVKNLLKEFDGDDPDEVYEKVINEHPEYFPPHILKAIKVELGRLQGLPGSSQEANMIKTYLDVIINLPYYRSSKDNEDINSVIKVLNEDHYGLEKQKDRIVQYLAVKQLTNSLKSPILCLFGPPGVGKTSLAISIARALGRKFAKISLGGVHDESEIRGHRRTYLGALPGKIITALSNCQVNNPVILLDEVDKLQDGGYHGDPSSALLEVLDPEQNYRFQDNYLGQEVDLSNVLFICTANDISKIPAPLRDRLELIPLYTYTKDEKMHIAKEYLLDLEYAANGVSKDILTFKDEAIDYIIEYYTREAGVRSLRRQLGTIMRKFAVKYLEANKNLTMEVTVDIVKEFLGKEIFHHDKKVENSQVGIVNGLAYTDAGGELLKIEVNTFPGKGNLIRTGNLGDVMKEACVAALTYLKTNAYKFGIDNEYFSNNDIHIHFPDTATPKDGPSAGIATALVILSAITGCRIRNDVAMTGEIDLRGNALPIGGLREKTLAAVREHVTTVLCPKENHSDVLELPKEITDNIDIKEVSTLDEVIPLAFLDNPIKDVSTTAKPEIKIPVKRTRKTAVKEM